MGPDTASGRQFGRMLLLTALLTVLACLGNVLKLSVAFSVDLIFGSVFTMIAILMFGPWWGGVCALLASLPTLWIWNHPFAIVIFTAEALFVGFWMRRRNRHPLFIVTAYWLLVGIPLVMLFYGLLQGLGSASVTIIALKQSLNGIFNVLLATLVVRYLPLWRWLGLDVRHRRFSFRDAIFDLTAFFLLIPCFSFVFGGVHKLIAVEEHRIASLLSQDATEKSASLARWLEQYQLAAREIMALGEECGLSPTPRLQTELKRIAELFPDFHNVYLANADARTVGFFPPVNARGESTIGLDFADREYFRSLRKTGRPVVSELFIGRGGVFEPIFSISYPWMDGGRLKGFGLGAVNTSKLRQFLVTEGRTDMPILTLLDAGGKVILSTDPEHIPMEPLVDPPGTRYEELDGTVHRWIPGLKKNVSPMDTWRRGRYRIKAPVHGSDWALLLEAPMAPVQISAYRLTIAGLTVIAAFHLLVLLLSSLVSKGLSRDHQRLVAFSMDLPSRMEVGEPQQWPEPMIMEVAEMTSHLRSIAEALGTRIKQLKAETELRLASERTMIQQSRQAAMGEMIGNIAHQWRQPLSALSILLANLRDSIRMNELDPADLATTFAKGDALIQKMSSTINDFRDFFKPDKAKEHFSALHQIHTTQDLVAASFEAAQIQLQIQADQDVQLFGFPNEFSQVLMNLLVNAKQAIQDSDRKDGRILICLDQTADNGRIRVLDNGGGVPPDAIDKVFEPFFTTRESGSGIGLYMSKQIIEGNMEGSLTFRNVDGGAEFEVILPSHRESQ